jgi:hypothetical protein
VPALNPQGLPLGTAEAELIRHYVRMRRGGGRIELAVSLVVVVLVLAACAGSDAANDVAVSATSLPSASDSPSGSQTPPLHPPVESLDCGPESNGINVSSDPYGLGSDAAPAKQATQLAGQWFTAKYPDAVQTLVYEDDARQDFAFKEADGTMRGYVSFVLKNGLWASNGEAFCSRA